MLRRPCASLRACLLAALLVQGFAAGARAAASPAARDTVATPDSLLTLATKGALVRAATRTALIDAGRQVEQCRAQLEHATGGRPDPITVIVVPFAWASAREEAQRRVAAGERVVLWVGPTLKPRRVSDAGPLADPEAAFQHTVGHALVESWAAAARARNRFEGEPVTGLVEGPVRTAPAVAHPTDGALAHRGADRLPDWYEEALAVTCEPMGAQRARIEWLRTRIEKRVPFPKLLALQTPEPRPAVFGSESYALLRFLLDQEDAYFLTRLAGGLLRGTPLPEVLAGASAVYSKAEALEGQWLEWMKDPSRRFAAHRSP